MENTQIGFYGQQEGERILYVVRPYPLAIFLHLLKAYAAAAAIVITFMIIGVQIKSFKPVVSTIGLTTGAVVALVGTLIVKASQQKSIAYVTDRRLVRFEPTNIFATNMRTLTWDEAVKVKTFPPNLVWKILMVGTVVIHARTTIVTPEEPKPSTVTADDIALTDVYYYRDLGNYIDKILFTYKRQPKEMETFKAFVPMPKGQRD
ncbi:hypothetical protein A2783_05175 [Microgenomates group bacterium RIFCSPHIGHO2_01_FULL_45_11]|nr:MAG: hypothetical protein A2783_05175 [Microgenomates group bacterium RIFCSPHIGHO2_01_FULL_45_11]